MPLNPMINLAADNANPLEAIIRAEESTDLNKQRDLANESLKLRNQAAEVTMEQGQRQMEARSMVDGAVQLNEYLKAGDIQGANRFLSAREKSILARGGDPSDTRSALERINAGDVDSVQNDVNSILQFGAQSGLLNRSGLTEYQKQSLDLQRQRLNQPTANERDLKTYQRLRETNPDDAEAFGRDVGLLPKSETLTSTGEKALIEAQDSYFKGTKDAREYELLAGDFQRELSKLPAGANYTFQEFIKGVTGSQDEATELRRRFNAVRLSEALVNLPPGAATDRDVQEAFKGVPKENAAPEQVISFLRGAAKLKALDNEFNLFKADYISEKNNTKGLLKAWQEKMRSGDVEALDRFEPGSTKSQQEQPTTDFSQMSDEELLKDM